MSQESRPTPLVIGAYSAAPSKSGWDPQQEKRYFDALSSLPGVTGYEVPFTETLHKYDENWLFDNLRHDSDIVVTLLSGTLARLKSCPYFGLASTYESGRRAAMAYTAEAAAAVRRLNRAFGREAVVAVEVHAAPKLENGASSYEALHASLVEMASLDWGGARLVVEHCDAPAGNRAPAKGLLPLSVEIEAVAKAREVTGTDLGIGLNWGRSVIETRDPYGATAHIKEAGKAGVLAGFVFSGCSDAPTDFGDAWADVHVPLAPDPSTANCDFAPKSGASALEPLSLLGTLEVRECLEATLQYPGIDYLGVKVSARPRATVEDRIAVIAQSVELVSSAASAL
ncbi:DUF4862 family protein [Cellulosimicrobium funkei]|nr:DUF4862 family protein [Cellulosimicrobium funkei]